MKLVSNHNAFFTTKAFVLCALHEMASATATHPPSNNNARQETDEQGDMIKGLAIGLGGFFGLVILLCLLWKCCCSSEDNCSCCPDRKKDKNNQKNVRGRRRMNDHSAKVSPSPPSSVMSWSRNS